MKRSILVSFVILCFAVTEAVAAEEHVVTLFDYVAWRGNLTFEQDPLNELDSAILSMISYIPFDGMRIEDSFEQMTLKEASALYLDNDDVYKNYENLTVTEQDTLVMLEIVAESKRFGDLALTYYVNHFDETLSKQFSAVTFSINPRLHFVAFRGTDNTITGWKEDFHMSFEKIIPSQREALTYLMEVAGALQGGLILGGHSKGGNLSVYAAMNSPREIQNRIESIWNFDGPGFFNDDVHKKQIALLEDRIHTFVPESSIIGMLLQHEEPYAVIACEDSILFQHNPFIWNVEPCQFVRTMQVSDTSLVINESIQAWVSTKSPQEIEAFIDVIFNSTQKAGIKTIQDLNADKGKALVSLFNAYNSHDKETQKMLRETASALFTISFRNIQAKAEKKASSTFKSFKLWKDK